MLLEFTVNLLLSHLIRVPCAVSKMFRRFVELRYKLFFARSRSPA